MIVGLGFEFAIDWSRIIADMESDVSAFFLPFYAFPMPAL